MTQEAQLGDARILIVDDQQANVMLLETILTEHGYRNLASTTDSRRALPLFLEQPPDLVLLDLHMPHLDGFAVLDQLTPRIPADTYLPILMLTAEGSSQAKRRALEAGAKDFVTKPLDVTEVLSRIKNLLHTRCLHRKLQQQNDVLEARVLARTQELEQAQGEIAERLAQAADYRDDATGQHIRRVGRGAALVAREMGWSEAEVDLIRRAAPLHDIGKIGIPDHILLKPGRLTPEEYEQMKDHAVLGARLLHGSHSRLLQMAEEIALMHHERWDGNGYAGIVGATIPLTARITSVVDVFDALTHRRPYKEPWPVPEAVAEIEQNSGTQFDPEVVVAFLRVLDQGGVTEMTGPDHSREPDNDRGVERVVRSLASSGVLTGTARAASDW